MYLTNEFLNSADLVLDIYFFNSYIDFTILGYFFLVVRFVEIVYRCGRDHSLTSQSQGPSATTTRGADSNSAFGSSDVCNAGGYSRWWMLSPFVTV
jgi:hypothetical protein